MKNKKIKELLKNQYSAKKVNKQTVNSFDSILQYCDIELVAKYELDKFGRFTLNILTYNYSHTLTLGRSFERVDTSNYLFGLIEGTTNIGTVFIRPETIRDKINELIKPIEIDFDNSPRFNKQFYVIAENEELVKKSLNRDFRELITKYESCEIEMKNNSWLLRINRISANKSNLEELIKFLKKLFTIIQSM